MVQASTAALPTAGCKPAPHMRHHPHNRHFAFFVLHDHEEMSQRAAQYLHAQGAGEARPAAVRRDRVHADAGVRTVRRVV